MHPASCTDPDCTLLYAEHLRGISLSAAATPNRRSHAAASLLKDRAWDRDLDAYQRLRRDGIQPPSNLGCAQLERTKDHRWEIETKPRLQGET